jgi:hypothetical protein
VVLHEIKGDQIPRHPVPEPDATSRQKISFRKPSLERARLHRQAFEKTLAKRFAKSFGKDQSLLHRDEILAETELKRRMEPAVRLHDDTPPVRLRIPAALLDLAEHVVEAANWPAQNEPHKRSSLPPLDGDE